MNNFFTNTEHFSKNLSWASMTENLMTAREHIKNMKSEHSLDRLEHTPQGSFSVESEHSVLGSSTDMQKNIALTKEHQDEMHGDFFRKNTSTSAEHPHQSSLFPEEERWEVCPLTQAYMSYITAMPRWYHSFLQNLSAMLRQQGIGTLSAHQGLLIYHIGPRTLPMGGVYKAHGGANPAYHVRHLQKEGYIQSVVHEGDKRRLSISLTVKGKVLWKRIHDILQKHARWMAHHRGCDATYFQHLKSEGQCWQNFWHTAVRPHDMCQGSAHWETCETSYEDAMSLKDHARHQSSLDNGLDAYAHAMNQRHLGKIQSERLKNMLRKNQAPHREQIL